MWKFFIILVIFYQQGCAQLVDFDFDNIFNPWFFNNHNNNNNNNNNHNRPGFVIRHHGKCTSTISGSGSEEGVCLTSRPECTFSGGVSQGRQSCRLGICCVYSNGCGQSSSKRVSYFEYNGNLNDFDDCQYTVRVENNNICQMRLDFDTFNLPAPTRETIPDPNNNNQPMVTGPYLCRDAYFQVTSPNGERLPILCGNNNGQHMYVNVNANDGQRALTMRIVGNNNNNNNNADAYSWRIKVTQLECASQAKHQKSYRVWEDSSLIAPPGCVQYYTANTGEIRNFGYNSGTAIAANHYQSNLYYAMCFRRTADTCGITFNVEDFRLSGTSSGIATDCSLNGVDLDYLFIPNGRYTMITGGGGGGGGGTSTVVDQNRFCGVAITTDTDISSVTPGPLYVFFKTDNIVANPDTENGFRLTYRILHGINCP